MHRWKPILFNIVFSLNCLLIFLVIFEQQLQVPRWLQVAGRMHPLVLHFPIVLLVLTVFWEVLPRKRKEETVAASSIGDALLISAAFTSVFTSLLGLFLSREDGYAPEVLLWHKWSGVAISMLTVVWYAFRQNVRQVKGLLVATTVLGLTGIVITGHQGANITHGENFLLAPLHTEEDKPLVLLEDAVVYTHMVKPILETKCMSCHNQQKAKGELLMESESSLLKGGKSGRLWDSTEKDFGLLFQRLHLPLENKKHMPPKGKPQLTEEEIAILYNWVRSGASFTRKVTDLPETDTLRVMAASLFSTVETDYYAFAAAEEKTVRKLNTTYCVITPLSAGSPALNVEFFSARKFDPAVLKSLLEIREQVVTLNLNRMPVKDEDLAIISQFTNLRKLNLSFTQISGATLPQLAVLTQLRQLSLSGTRVNWSQVQALTSLPRLSRIFLWNTAITEKEMSNAAASYKNISFQGGYQGDTVVLKLNPPLLENDEQILVEPVSLKLKHYVSGTEIRYTLDGTEPDSLKSAVFTGSVNIDRNLVVKARAYKKGWISSDAIERHFYKAGLRPDTILLVTQPDPLYKGEGGVTLTDTQKGDFNFRSGKWLGYKENSLTSVLQFKKSVTLSSVTVSALIDVGSYIMPPQQVEVWGGSDGASLRLLKRLQPDQPREMTASNMQGFGLSFAPATVSIIKVVVKPVQKLPAWHPGKGQRGWIFVDELLLN